jgi:hypothetical protein
MRLCEEEARAAVATFSKAGVFEQALGAWVLLKSKP